MNILHYQSNRGEKIWKKLPYHMAEAI